MATTNATAATAATTGKTYTTITVLCKTVIPSENMINDEDGDEKVTFALSGPLVPTGLVDEVTFVLAKEQVPVDGPCGEIKNEGCLTTKDTP